ncbi:MAG: spore maturation protein [Lachnospiraceae bacterium]|nr:spore maturation protein [Lachnospiraceae bacterium]
MGILLYLSELIIPFMVFYVMGNGLASKVPVYDSFRRGAQKGLEMVVKLAPALIGLMVATGVLRASGFLDLAAVFIGRILPDEILPSAVVPLGVVKLFSSSAATGLLLDIFREYGTDSYTGLTASLMLCSTETVFYTMSIYYTSVGIKKTRYTLYGALFASMAGMAASVVLARWMLR